MDKEILLVLGGILLIFAFFGLLIYVWLLTVWKKPSHWCGVEIVNWASSSVIKGPDGSYKFSNSPWQIYDDVVLRLNVNGRKQNRRYASVRVCRGIILHPGEANLVVIEDIRFKPGKLNNVLSVVASEQGHLLYSPILMRESLPYFGAGCMLNMMVIAALSVFIGILTGGLSQVLKDYSSGAEFFVVTPLLFILLTISYIAFSVWAKKRLYAKIEKILKNAYPDQYIV